MAMAQSRQIVLVAAIALGVIPFWAAWLKAVTSA
jgi:hypothetical protein